MAESTDHIVDALREVYDPCCREKAVSVVDMGLLHAVEVAGVEASIQLVLTTGWCPFAIDLCESVRRCVESLPGITSAKVEVVWDEVWTSDRLSEDARRKLRFLPEPLDVTDRTHYIAARHISPHS